MDDDKKHIWSLDDVITITEPEVTTEIYSLPEVKFQYSGSNTAGIMAQEISNTIDLSNITMGAVGSAGNYSYPYTIGTAWGTDTITASGISTSISQSGTIELRGEDADIVVNGVSLMDKLDAIAERLNLLDVNKELEEEWDQLRELGERYRELEQECKAKSEMWKTLKTKTSSKPRS
jgi:hypothetical protein